MWTQVQSASRARSTAKGCTRARGAATLAALAALCGASVASAQIVVLNARGPSSGAYPQGAVLAPGRMISLKAGDQLEVIDASGSHILTGPVNMAASQIATGSQATLKDIFSRANASHAGIAAVRGFSLDEGATPPAPEVPPLWRLDVVSWQQGEPTDTRSFCVVKGQSPVLTRSDASSEGKLVIYSGGASRTVTWPAGAHNLTWPADLPVADGASFVLNLDEAGATNVRWRTVPAAAPSLTALAQSLLDSSCFDQLDTLQTQVASK